MSRDLVAMQAIRYDVKVYYVIFSDFMTFYFILFKLIYQKIENIGTLLLPTVCSVYNPL